MSGPHPPQPKAVPTARIQSTAVRKMDRHPAAWRHSLVSSRQRLLQKRTWPPECCSDQQELLSTVSASRPGVNACWYPLDEEPRSLSRPAGGPREGPLKQLGPRRFKGLLKNRGFPGGTVAKNSSANAADPRDMGSIPGSGRSPGGGHSNPL